MMRRIVWADTARAEFQGLLDYVNERNPQGVATIIRNVGQAVELLADRPHGRQGRVTGTYEKSVSGIPYVIAYELDDTAPAASVLVILRIIHTARNWQPESWPD